MQGMTQKMALYLPEAQRHPSGELARQVQVCLAALRGAIMICNHRPCTGTHPGLLEGLCLRDMMRDQACCNIIHDARRPLRP